MNQQKLISLIKESRSLLSAASPEQRMKLLSLIKESIQSLKLLKQSETAKTKLSENADYIEEK
jgi:hypothetical protein